MTNKYKPINFSFKEFARDIIKDNNYYLHIKDEDYNLYYDTIIDTFSEDMVPLLEEYYHYLCDVVEKYKFIYEEFTSGKQKINSKDILLFGINHKSEQFTKQPMGWRIDKIYEVEKCKELDTETLRLLVRKVQEFQTLIGCSVGKLHEKIIEKKKNEYAIASQEYIERLPNKFRRLSNINNDDFYEIHFYRNNPIDEKAFNYIKNIVFQNLTGEDKNDSYKLDYLTRDLYENGKGHSVLAYWETIKSINKHDILLELKINLSNTTDEEKLDLLNKVFAVHFRNLNIIEKKRKNEKQTIEKKYRWEKI